MGPFALLAVGIVALIHVFIGILEMFLWTNPKVHSRLRPKVDVTQSEAQKVAPIVANVGLYNWFLAAGLIWTLLPASVSLLPEAAIFPVQAFFLIFIMIAGVYGALTISPRILIIQTAPAAAALLFAWLGPRS